MGSSCRPQQEEGLWAVTFASHRLSPGFYSGHMYRANSLTSYALPYQWPWRLQNTLQGNWVRVHIQLLHNKSAYISFFTSKHEILDVGLPLDARKLVVQSVSLMYTGRNFFARISNDDWNSLIVIAVCSKFTENSVCYLLQWFMAWVKGVFGAYDWLTISLASRPRTIWIFPPQ